MQYVFRKTNLNYNSYQRNLLDDTLSRKPGNTRYMMKNNSSLFYVCSLLEYIGRLCKIERSKLVNQQPRCRASGYVVLIRWLQSVLIPFVTTQSVRVLNPPHESTWEKQYKKTLQRCRHASLRTD